MAQRCWKSSLACTFGDRHEVRVEWTGGNAYRLWSQFCPCSACYSTQSLQITTYLKHSLPNRLKGAIDCRPLRLHERSSSIKAPHSLQRWAKLFRLTLFLAFVLAHAVSLTTLTNSKSMMHKQRMWFSVPTWAGLGNASIGFESRGCGLALEIGWLLSNSPSEETVFSSETLNASSLKTRAA